MKIEFEQIIKETTKTIDLVLYKFKRLKTDREDLKQEIIIKIWQLNEEGKFENITDINSLNKYVYKCAYNHLQSVLLKEHKQGLWVTESIYKDNFELTDMVEYTDNTLNFFYDEYLEYKKEYFKKYNIEHKEHIREVRKKWYEEHKEEKKAYQKKYWFIKHYGEDNWNKKLEKEKADAEVAKLKLRKEKELEPIKLLEKFLFETCFIYNFARIKKYNKYVIQLEIEDYYNQKVFIKDMILEYIRNNEFEFRINENKVEFIKI